MRLQISVQDAVTVRLVDRPRHLFEVGGGSSSFERPVLDKIMQALPNHVAHGIERSAANFADLIDMDDVLVFQLGGRLGLCSEAFEGLASFLGTQPFQTV